METILTELPKTIYGWIALIGFTFLTIAQVVLLVRRNEIKTLRESNEDLRKRVEDLDKNYKELVDQVGNLKGANEFLKEIVGNALEIYFEHNPKAALRLRKEIAKG